MIALVPGDLSSTLPADSTDEGCPTSDPYDADGIDRSLIRWMLRLSPTERLAYVQGAIDMVNSVRRPANGDR
ncbi:MAG: hypothetical protein ACOY0T_25510 [Myxococcota bacterium]